jgi:glycosyltransferase involved in cell wall biosynthesis
MPCENVMPKLLIAATVPQTLTAFLCPFAAHFRAQGWRVDAIANGAAANPQCLQAFDQVWDISWSRNPLHPRNSLSAPKRLRALVANEGYDLVHVHTPVAALVARWALRRLRRTAKTRVLYTAHGFHFYEGGPRLRGGVFRRLEQWAGRWTDYLVVINREDERAALRYRIVPPERLVYMPGIGVDCNSYSAADVGPDDVDRVRRELDLAPTDRVFLMIGEYIPRKRPLDVVRAFARLQRPNARMVLVGGGPLHSELQRLAAQLDIESRVRILGFRRDIPTLIQASVATLLTSEQEGLPRSVMESLCQGIPVIGSRIRGMTDLLDDGRGLLVPVGDVGRVAEAMTWVLDHPLEARALGGRGRDAMESYDLQHILRLHEDLYDAALNSHDREIPAAAAAAAKPQGARS